jgi:glycosyltransferase involved in cell wall biosynthesis
VPLKCVNDRLGESLLHALICYASDLSDLFLKQIDVFITASRFVSGKLVSWGVPEERIRVVPHFTHVDHYRPSSPKSDGYVAYVGRLADGKGVGTLMRAARQVPGTRFVLVGDGPLLGSLREQAAELGADNVEFVGRAPRDDLKDLLGGAMFVVAPSECYETFGLSIIESFALGKPVVASRIGAFPEIVDDGRTGLLFEPGNADELAERITRLSRDAAAREEMGREARSVVEAKFAPQSHYVALEEVYRAALLRRGNGS